MVQMGEKRNLMKYFYPAIFTLDRKKNEFRAVFPDLTGCAVKAESMAEAARKAREALGMALMELEEKGIEFPAASDECALQRAYPYCQVGVVFWIWMCTAHIASIGWNRRNWILLNGRKNLNAAALHCFREFLEADRKTEEACAGLFFCVCCHFCAARWKMKRSVRLVYYFEIRL